MKEIALLIKIRGPFFYSEPYATAFLTYMLEPAVCGSRICEIHVFVRGHPTLIKGITNLYSLFCGTFKSNKADLLY